MHGALASVHQLHGTASHITRSWKRVTSSSFVLHSFRFGAKRDSPPGCDAGPHSYTSHDPSLCTCTMFILACLTTGSRSPLPALPFVPRPQSVAAPHLARSSPAQIVLSAAFVHSVHDRAFPTLATPAAITDVVPRISSRRTGDHHAEAECVSSRSFRVVETHWRTCCVRCWPYVGVMKRCTLCSERR